MLMTYLKPLILEYFSCYGKFGRHYVEFPAKCALQKSHPLTVLNCPMVLLSLTQIFLHSLLFVILSYQLCSYFCSHFIVNTFFNLQVSSKPFPSILCLEICFSLRVHSVTAVLSTHRGRVRSNSSYILWSLSFPSSCKNFSLEVCHLIQLLFFAFHHCCDLLTPWECPSYFENFSLPL